MKTKSDKYNIICLSNQIWDFPLWTNKKHVMWRMPKRGHNVLFVDPPINTGNVFLRHVLQGRWSLKRLITQQYTDEKVRVFSPLNIIPFYEFLGNIHSKKVNRIANKIFDTKRPTILWIYNVEIPGIASYIKNIKHDFLVYDCVDNYSAFPRYNTKEKKEAINKQELYLTQRSNVVFTTAPGIYEKLKKHNSNTYYTPNVGDFERFFDVRNKAWKTPDDLKDIPEPRIGFTGAVDEYKFDKELMKKIAKDYPRYSFVIIGPAALKDKESTKKELGFEGYENIYFLGRKDFTILPRYISKFDVMIIPYQLNDYTVGGCFPVKFFEPMAAGIPVVVTDLPAYSPFRDVCYISKDYNDFSHNIRKAMEEDSPARSKAAQKAAKENTWDGKIDTMLKIISKHLK